MKKIDIKRLFKAIEDDHRTTLAQLLDSNADALEILGEHNSFVRDKTPLMYAIQCFNIELAGYLLDRGANACAIMPAGPCDTVLEMCVERAYSEEENHDEWIDLTKRLLDAGADASTRALWRALYSFGGIVDRPDIIRFLLDHGADPDQLLGDSGNTIRELVQVNAHCYTPAVLELFGVTKQAATKKMPAPAVEPPFLEHPNGDHRKAREALTEAMQRLDELGEVERWINFDGQGRGQTDETYECRTVAYRNGILDLEISDRQLQRLLKASGLSIDKVSRDKKGRLVLTSLTPSERGAFMNVLFLKHFKLKPTLRDRDYGVCVEWC